MKHLEKEWMEIVSRVRALHGEEALPDEDLDKSRSLFMGGAILVMKLLSGTFRRGANDREGLAIVRDLTAEIKEYTEEMQDRMSGHGNA